MDIQNQNLERAADKRADKRSLVLVYGFTALSWLILSNADHAENEKAGLSLGWQEPWLTQLTSHIAIMIAILMIPFLLSRFVLTLENWRRKLLIYILGFFIFGSLHIVLMNMFRSLSFPSLLDRPYNVDLLDIKLWLYELPKDAYTYLLVLSIFLAGRHMEQLRLEAVNTKQDAKDTGRLMLKSGGRRLFIHSHEIVRAEAASNYLELETTSGQHLIRMTLTGLEKLIAEAGNTHIRIHRSHLVKIDAIRELIPNGDGGANVKLKNERILPVGRKYRNGLNLSNG